MSDNIDLVRGNAGTLNFEVSSLLFPIERLNDSRRTPPMKD